MKEQNSETFYSENFQDLEPDQKIRGRRKAGLKDNYEESSTRTEAIEKSDFKWQGRRALPCVVWDGGGASTLLEKHDCAQICSQWRELEM